MTNIYTEIGGVSFGGYVATSPFAKITITPDQIEINIRGILSSDDVIEIKKSEIEQIIRKKSLFGTGIKIEHSNDFVAPHLVYGTRTYKQLKAALINMGYTIHE